MKSISAKIGLLIFTCILATIGFMYALTDFLYERLYVEDTEAAMIEIATKLQSQYHGGSVTDDYVAYVEDYNKLSNHNVFAVRNPKELSACVPFDIDYHTLIGPAERKLLVEGKHFTEIGYVERFGRDLITVVVPLVDGKRLEGIIYTYYPLAKISEFATSEVLYFIMAAIVFTLLIGFLCYTVLRQILKPLRELFTAVKKMSSGDYAARVSVQSKDEIGQLSHAFNEMAASIQLEDDTQKTFLATVSHELRTPISYVKGYSDILQKGYVDEQQKDDMLRLIAREAARMEHLTNEIMQLVRKEQQPLNMSFVIVGELLREVLQILHMKLEDKHMNVQWDIDETLIIDADENRVKQMFINIIENAILYSDAYSQLTLRAVEEGDFAKMTILDTGVGIPAEDLPKITQRFFRVNKARSRADGGSGLGLAIVEQLVKQHHGKLAIDSELGIGTVVTIWLPLTKE